MAIDKIKVKRIIEKKLFDDIHDLWARDITELVTANRMKEARSVAKYLGVPEKVIDQIIQEYKNPPLKGLPIK